MANQNDDVYHWRHYILDITDYTDVSMCRILVTRRYYSNLLQYEPTVHGGPWYWDTTSKVHYHLQSILGFDGKRHSLVMEFWRESEPIGVSKPGFDWSVIQDIGNETFFVLMLRYLFCLKKFASLQKARAPKNNKREEIQHGRFDSLAHLSLL